jgi:hypothetical protein
LCKNRHVDKWQEYAYPEQKQEIELHSSVQATTNNGCLIGTIILCVLKCSIARAARSIIDSFPPFFLPIARVQRVELK